MKSVYILQHLNVLPDGEEDVKLIGAYSSRETAIAAIERLRFQPGFRNHPLLLDPTKDDEITGFYLDEYQVDRDHWAGGYVTV